MSIVRNLEFTMKDGSTETFENVKNFYNTGEKLVIEYSGEVSEIHYSEVRTYRYV